MNLKTVTALTLSVAFAATLAAAPQGTKPAPAKSAPAAAKAPAGETVAAADIPGPVKDAVMKMHPKATITGATKTMKGTEAWYKVSFKDGEKTGSATLDAMGKPAPAKTKKK